MESGDISASLDSAESDRNENAQTQKNIFEFDDSYGYDIYDSNDRASFEKKVKSGAIIRSTKHANKKVAVLRWKERQARKKKHGDMVDKIVFWLGVVGCVSCCALGETDQLGSAFAFFSDDYDGVLGRKRTRLLNPEITDVKLLSKLHKPKRSGSTLRAHLEKCNPSLLKSPDEKSENSSGVKNTGQLLDKKTHILQTKTAAAMMVIAGGIPMSFLQNPYLPVFCDLTASLRLDLKFSTDFLAENPIFFLFFTQNSYKRGYNLII